MTFTVTIDGHPLKDFAVEADFMTLDASGYYYKFWIKTNWYSRRRCVAMFKQNMVKGISTEGATNWAKELGVKI